jgi:hypothetical protein
MTRPARSTRAYRQLWRVVAGAVNDALGMHPEYLTAAGRRSAARSITKRVTGAVIGYAEQSARGRSGASPAADEAAGGGSVGRRSVGSATGREAAGFAKGLAAFLRSRLLSARAAIGWRR